MSKPGTDTANFSIRDSIAYVELDKFPVNSLATGLTYGVTDAINQIDEKAKTGEVKGVVLYGAGRSFCAGADFVGGMGKKSDKTPVKLNRSKVGMFGFEEIKVPVVAAIHGFALGGGLELALDCHYRVIASDAKVGLPEVNIGFLPGAQGTQRLPRIMGADNALKLMTTGEHVAAKEALAWGIVDEIAPVNGVAPVDAATEYCRSKIGVNLDSRRISLMSPPEPSEKGFDAWRSDMQKTRSGEVAPQLIIDCVEAACKSRTFAEGVKFEQQKFSGPGGVLDPSASQFQELQYMFSAERNAGKTDGIKAEPVPIKTVGVIGAGLMGGGIAMSCAEAGIKVKILDTSEAALNKGLGLIETNYKRSVQRGSRTQHSATEARGNITGILDFAAFSDCDLIVEAVFEEIGVKKDIFKKLDAVAKPGAFLCSNTSALDVDAIAAATSRPEFVMGTHFFSPANVMKVLENVRGAKTSDVTIATCMAWGRQIGKWPILVGNCPGFVGNRLIFLYNNMAQKVLTTGAFPSDVDSAIEGFGMKMGPFRMADMVGLDLGIQARKKSGQFQPDKVLRDAIIDSGRLGQKNGKGFYDYSDGRTAKPSAEVNELVTKFAETIGKTKRVYTKDELVGLMFFPLVNEGFKVLEEGFAQRPADIDVCYVHGYGFPRYRGGPMYYADKVGLKTVRDTLVELGMKPAALLEECVAMGTTLAKHWPKYQKANSKL